MRYLAACSLLTCAVACGGDAGSAGIPSGTFSCSAGFAAPDGGAGTALICVEGSGGNAQDYENNRSKCLGQGSSFKDAACSRTNAAGGCRVHQGAVTLTTWYYVAAEGASGADIQQICSGLGLEFVSP